MMRDRSLRVAVRDLSSSSHFITAELLAGMTSAELRNSYRENGGEQHKSGEPSGFGAVLFFSLWVFYWSNW